MLSSKGLSAEIMPITHVNGVKGLLSKVFSCQSLWKWIQCKHYSWTNHRLLRVKSPRVGPLCLRGSLKMQGPNSFDWVHLAGLEERPLLWMAKGLLSWDQFIRFNFPLRSRNAFHCGNFITYSWFNISSKCTDLSGLFSGKGGTEWGVAAVVSAQLTVLIA